MHPAEAPRRRGLIRENVSLQPLHTLATPHRTQYFAQAHTLEELREALDFAQVAGLPVLPLGAGSNILFTRDWPGLALRIDLRGRRLLKSTAQHHYLQVAAGEPWHPLVRDCLRRGFYGLENLSLIPGTAGAAPIQNIGAYGVELREFLMGLEVLELANGALHQLEANACRFTYRDSAFKGPWRNRFLILSLHLRLQAHPRPQLQYPSLQQALAENPESPPTPQQLSDTVIALRQTRLPDPQQLPNAGSFFRNPQLPLSLCQALQQEHPTLPLWPAEQEEGHKQAKLSAGWLLEQTGWKNYRADGVGTSQHHAGILINYDRRPGNHLLDLAQRMRNSVKERFNVELHVEPLCL